MRLLKRSVLLFGCCVFVLALVVPLSVVIHAWQARWRAERILAVIQTLQPGKTSEAEARARLHVESAVHNSADAPWSKDVEFQWDNGYPGFERRVLQPLPEAVAYRMNPLHWTLFLASVKFREGVVAEERVVLMQEVQTGDPHPASVSVRFVTSRFEPELEPDLVRISDGFSSHLQHGQRINEQTGQLLGPEIDPEEFIRFDERASGAQKAKALDLQLHCMTSFSPCNQVRQLGHVFPVTKDPLFQPSTGG